MRKLKAQVLSCRSLNNTMARPTKLTDESQATIIRALSAGGTREDASHAAGVEYNTFLNWMKRGEKAKKGEYFEFFGAVTKAEADVRLSLANAFASAGQKDWHAAADYLKRRDPANWGDRLKLSSLSDDDLLRLLGILESRASGSGEEGTKPETTEATDIPAE